MHLREVRRDDHGTILLLTAMLLVVFLGLAALAVDAAMAWSNRRASQGIADTSVMAALQAIPRTVVPANNDTAAIAAAESFTATNATANAADVAVDRVSVEFEAAQGARPGKVTVELDLGVTSATIFGRSIGADDAIDFPTSAIGQINFYLPGAPNADGQQTMQLLPLGAESGGGTMVRCLAAGSASCPQGSDTDLKAIAFKRQPTMCFNGTTSFDLTIANLREGVDHLIEIDGPQTGQRKEDDVCQNGHQLSFPNWGRRVRPERAPNYIHAIIEKLKPSSSTHSPPLWTYLEGGLPGSCNRAIIEAAAPDVDRQTQLMGECLRSGRPNALSNLSIHDSRLGWGVTAPGEESYYRGLQVFWIHSVISGTQQTYDPDLAGTDYEGYVAFLIPTAMLPDSFVQSDPLGRNSIEFSLID